MTILTCNCYSSLQLATYTQHWENSTVSTWQQLDISSSSYQNYIDYDNILIYNLISVFVLTIHFSYSIDSTLLGSILFSAPGCFCLAYHTYLTRQEERILHCSKLDRCSAQGISVYVCSSHHATGDLMLIAVDQKDRNLQPIAIS